MVRDQADKVKVLTEKASKLGLPLVEAKQYLQRQQAKSLGVANERYKPFLATKGLYSLEHFSMLRREGNYAKGEYLKKSYYKKMRLVFQKDDIPRSLFKLSIAYCGKDPAKSKAVKKLATQVFKTIRGYMGDIFHNYPTTLAMELIDIGRKEPLLRDEIFCQLIKQTSSNPFPDSLLKGWRLIFLCAANFPCSKELAPFLLSHAASYAHTELPAEIGFNSVKDLATNVFFAVESVKGLDGKKLPMALQQDTVADITKGTHPPLAVAAMKLGASDNKDSKDSKSKK